MKKKTVAVLMAAAMAVSMMGCGSTGSTDSGSTDSAGTTESSDEVITLTYPCIWVGTDSKAEVFGQMIEGFNEEYAGKYQVVIEEQTDYDAYADKLRTQISTGDAPDIFSVKTRADVELYAESGKLMDMTEFLSSDDMASRFSDGSIEAAQIDGVNYAFPYENAVIPIMYNKEILDRYGIGEPESFEDLLAAGQTLSDNGVSAFTESTASNAWFAMLWYSYAVAAAGGEDVYENGLTDPAFVTAAEIVQQMFGYTTKDAIGGDATAANGHFFNDETAYYINGTWILSRIKSEGTEGLYDNLGISGGLSVDGANGGAFINQVQAYLCAAKQDDPAKQAAVEAFFTYITDPDRVTELSVSSGSLFAINTDASQYTDPVQKAIVEKSAEATFTIGTFEGSVSTAVAAEFPTALESLLIGDTTPEEFVQQLIDADN